MRQVVLGEENSVTLETLPMTRKIFAIRDGCLIGLIVCNEEGWYISTGASGKLSGLHGTRKELVEHATELYQVTFVVDVNLKD